MQITADILESNRSALVTERDGYLAEAERLRGQATAVEGAIRILDHLLALARRTESDEPKP